MNGRTKALQIPQAVKRRVHERDGGCCIFCCAPGDPWCHYIGRAQGGLGIEENIITMCTEHHRVFDQGTKAQREALRALAKEYLSRQYPGWDEEHLIYRKDGT